MTKLWKVRVEDDRCRAGYRLRYFRSRAEAEDFLRGTPEALAVEYAGNYDDFRASHLIFEEVGR